MVTRIVAYSMVAGMALGLFGCATSPDPEEVVRSYYQASSRGDCATADELATAEFAATDACENRRPVMLRDARVESAAGNRAVVQVDVNPGSLSRWSDSVHLVREAGEWRISAIDINV